MISISTTDSNTYGNVVVKNTVDYKRNEARLSRVKTLDGGVIINHFGTAVGDVTLNIKTNMDEITSNKLWDIFSNNTKVIVSMSDGLFLAALQKVEIKGRSVKIIIFIEQREN